MSMAPSCLFFSVGCPEMVAIALQSVPHKFDNEDFGGEGKSAHPSLLSGGGRGKKGTLHFRSLSNRNQPYCLRLPPLFQVKWASGQRPEGERVINHDSLAISTGQVNVRRQSRSVPRPLEGGKRTQLGKGGDQATKSEAHGACQVQMREVSGLKRMYKLGRRRRRRTVG